MDGHIRKGCFNLIRYLEWYKSNNKASGQPFRQAMNIKNENKIVATVEGAYREEDNPLETSDATMKIDELSAMLNSLKQKVTKLAKGKVALTTSTKLLYCYPGSASDSSFMTFIGIFNLNSVCCASICENTSRILDIRAIDHTSSNKTLFKSLQLLDKGFCSPP